MDDLISRQKAIDFVGSMNMCDEISNEAYEKLTSYLDELPSIQPERKTGRWIESNPQDSKLCRLMTCSECGKAYIVNINIPYGDWTEAHKFCVECGADMRGEQWFEHMPSAQPDTTTYDSNVVKKGGNDEDRTTDGLVSRQAAKDIFTELYGISAIGSVFDKYEWADICETTANELPSAQPFYNITMIDVMKYIDDMPEDVWQEFTACLECRGWELQKRTAKWCGGDFA